MMNAACQPKSERNQQYLVENMFLSTLIWTVGACVTETSRLKFDAFFRKFIAGTPELATEYTIVEASYNPRPLDHSIPEEATVYDFFFDGSSWISIDKRVPQLTLSNNADVHDILVPTVDTTRNVLFLQTAVRGGLHVLLAGPTGTGKTKIIASQLKRGFDKQMFTSLSLCLSAKSTTNDTQDAIDAKMDRSEGGIYTAATKRQCLIFLDDIGLPVKDAYGAQPVIELLRQCLSSGGWYDRGTWRFKQLRCFQLLAAIGSPERGTISLSQRFLRHFNMVYLVALCHDSLTVIYQTLLKLRFDASPPELQRLVGKITRFLVDFHERICANIISTPSRPHYVFSLRDLTRVTLGLCASSDESLQSSTELYKCCIHECERVYSDRLICREDKESVSVWLRECLKANLGRSYEELVADDQPLLFCGFVNPQKALYQQCTLPDVRQAAENYLQEYNKMNVKRPLNLVFFVQALEHLTRTVRILCQPCGNALLLGLGGSGRKTVTKLASFIAGHELCTVEPTVSYSAASWREDLKSILVKTGCHLKDVTFMLTDTQLENEDLLQDTASILSSGEVPNIFTVEDKIAQIRRDLETLKPQLEQASVETASLMSSIANMQKEAAATKATVQAEEALCDQQATNATRVKEQCHEELEQAMPALLAAIEALKKLSKADITELNSLKSPPSGVVKVMVALCKMFYITPVKVKGPDGLSKVEDYWTASKKHLLSDTRLLQKLFSYDRDNIPTELMRDIAPYLKDPDFNPEVIRKASVAATSLCKWVRAIIVYDQVAKGVEPKRAALRSAEAAWATASKNLENKKTELRAVEDLVGRLLNEQRAAQTKKDALKRQFDDCSSKLQVAERLLCDLATERERWMASSDALKEQIKTLLGELLLTSGVIAYNGAFTSAYRQECISSWFQSLVAAGIPVPAKYDLQTALGEPLQIQQWICNLLPNDSVSIENAIMLTHSKRWPMLIDPQKQATRWLKKSNPDMKVLRASDRKYFGQLKTAVEMGAVVFLEHCSDSLDPALSPILARSVFKNGNINVIRLQEVNVEYSSGFKLYLATYLPNPHFKPETCAELTILNFSVTVEGLEDQLLNTVLSLEHPDVEAKRHVLVAESATNKQQLMALEEKILLLLSNAKGNVLDDTELLSTLSSSKLAAQGIGNRVSELEKTQEVLHATRAGYQPVANRGARLYDVLLDLGFIEEMYQFSAEWYIAIFTQAVESARMVDNTTSGTNLRLEQVDKQFLLLLYDNVCRSLFGRHKFVFSLMLALKVIEISGNLNYKQLQLLLKGGATPSGRSIPKPLQTDWLPDVAWDRLAELEDAGDIFRKLTADLASNPHEWKAFLNEPDPGKLEWPHSLREGVSELERCLVVQALRPDCLLKCMKTLVEDCLGREFLESPPFDLLYSYKLTTPTRPLLFLLSSGADPMEEILKLAQAQRMKNKLSFVSLGQGQERRAAAAINSAVEAGAWALLQNCHLGSGFLSDLERIVEDLSFQDIHPDFRLLLTSMPSPSFPVSILLNSVKITSEAPRGLRENTQRTYRSFDSKFLNEHLKPEAWKKLLFGLSFFHALLTERRRFGPLGWNVSYEFSQNDFSISVQQLRQLLADLDPIPWDMLKYLTSEINYGGRVIDPWDRTLHPNADLTVAIAEGNAILDAILSSKPRSGGKERSWSFADPAEIARVIEEQLPGSIEIRAAQRRYTTLFKEALLPVLLQELALFDSLLTVTHKHLKSYQDAVEGKALLTPALEEFGNSLINNRVPCSISAAAYPSLKSLSSWVKDLLERLDFFQTWLASGPPSVFWISAFFRPQSFLTAVLQRHARDASLPVDEIDFDFEVLPVYANTGEEPDKADRGSYIYGLYMDGARWSLEEQIIAEPFPRILYYEMPIIWLKPVETLKRSNKPHVYECPVYRTAARAGSLSTSGISTNFILAVYLPVGPNHGPRYWTKRGVALLAQLSD
ncbi:UNVERIFIED_CONTAM: hypothetical protein H355_007866 [Colinus virginianus]|nr:hypothetical protein H355_007866 [Colinus virginianus]